MVYSHLGNQLMKLLVAGTVYAIHALLDSSEIAFEIDGRLGLQLTRCIATGAAAWLSYRVKICRFGNSFSLP